MFIREVALMMFQDWGHDTLSAGDVEEALVHLRSAEHIDALFTDIYLTTRVLGGCELAYQAVELWPKLRVLYTSGNSTSDKMQALFVKGAHFLCKPYSSFQLQDSVEHLLAN